MFGLPGGTGNDNPLEVGAVGATALEGQEASTSAGDRAVAVVTSTSTLLDNRSQGQGGEGEHGNSLHCEDVEGEYLGRIGLVCSRSESLLIKAG